MKLEVGKRVRIIGDPLDGTEQFHGQLGTIVALGLGDCQVNVDGANFNPWWIWNHNMVEPDAEI